MGIVKEPKGVDFEFLPQLLTVEEKNTISDYIKDYKSKHALKNKVTKKATKIRKSSVLQTS